MIDRKLQHLCRGVARLQRPIPIKSYVIREAVERRRAQVVASSGSCTPSDLPHAHSQWNPQLLRAFTSQAARDFEPSSFASDVWREGCSARGLAPDGLHPSIDPGLFFAQLDHRLCAAATDLPARTAPRKPSPHRLCDGGDGRPRSRLPRSGIVTAVARR
jgi:hypothetical protein